MHRTIRTHSRKKYHCMLPLHGIKELSYLGFSLELVPLCFWGVWKGLNARRIAREERVGMFSALVMILEIFRNLTKCD